MGKHEPLTAKAIGKRIKSKGLQKLKFYCQMCQKQCRDANGFKCHLTSEAHQRQLLLFAENPNRYMDDFSSEFMKDFLHLLKRRYSTKRVLANQVYQEYIKDRNHLHMNATRWCTLTGFVKWMGRKGICHVENNEKGWFITYIDRDPETLLKNENKAKKEKLFRDDEERKAKMIEEQIERGKLSQMQHQLKNGIIKDESSKDNSDNQLEKGMLIKQEDQKITFSLNIKKTPIHHEIKPEKAFDEHLTIDITKQTMRTAKQNKHLIDEKTKKKSALDEIIEEQERWKAKRAQKANVKPETWMIPGIVVRVICEELGKDYHEKKATIQSVESFSAMIKMLSNGHLIRVDECHLETVIPSKSGSRVMILRGLYRGQHGTIVNVDQNKQTVFVQVDQASTTEAFELAFDDVSKLSSL